MTSLVKLDQHIELT